MTQRLLFSFALLFAGFLAASPLQAADPNATVPDAWVLDSSGRVSGAFNVGATDWTESAAPSGPNVDISLSGGGTPSFVNLTPTARRPDSRRFAGADKRRSSRRVWAGTRPRPCTWRRMA